MATFLPAPTAGRFNVWIPPAHLGNIGKNKPGQFPQGAYTAWNTLAEAVKDVTSHRMGVILDPNGKFSAQQAWAGASAFTGAAVPPPTAITPAPPAQPARVPARGNPMGTSVTGLPPITDLNTASPRGDIEALAVTKTPNGMRIALRFRSRKAGEYPNDLTLKLTQGALGVVVLKKFSEVVKPVAPGSPVSEGEITVDYSEFAAQGVKSGSPLGFYAKWTKFGSHDRDFGENPKYRFNAP